jgi:hypothetical protein
LLPYGSKASYEADFKRLMSVGDLNPGGRFAMHSGLTGPEQRINVAPTLLAQVMELVPWKSDATLTRCRLDTNRHEQSGRRGS